MKYMGSKNRIAKEILPIILENRKSDQWYVEPFVGGGNLIDKVEGNRLGSDLNEYLIEALKLIRDNPESLPKNNLEFTEEDYNNIRNSTNKAMIGYSGFVFSYGAKWFNSWSRDGANKRDYVGEGYRNAQKQSPKLQGVKLVNSSYDKLEIPKEALIYCDPPYRNTGKYKGVDAFDHDKFYNWCRLKHNEGYTIFVSEYNMPKDFECLWQKEIVSSLSKNTGAKKGIEKLFKYKGRVLK